MRGDEFIFENLDVYQKSLSFAVEICKFGGHIPFEYSRIRDQFIGAALSVPLNIAEGSGRGSNKDKMNFYKIGRSSAFECIPLIEICFKLNLIDKFKAVNFKKQICDISKMLSGLINYHKESK